MNEDTSIEEILNYVKGLFDMTKETLDRVDALEDTLYKQILEPAQQLSDDYERGKRFDEFNGKYGEQLGAFNDKLKAIEGDDFDLTKKTFDDYDASDKSIAPDDYVAALISKVQAQLDKISAAFGGGNIEVEAKDENEDGKTEEVTVETDSDDNGEGDKTEAAIVDEEATEEAGKDAEEELEEKEEEIAEDSGKEESNEEEAEEPEDSPEEVEKDLKDLEEEYNRLYKE